MVAADDEKGRIALSQNGDHAAFESLVREYQKMIHSLCYRMTGSLADSEDLAQDTFIHAFRRLDTFRSESKFSSWLYRIAMNLCLNWKKAAARRDQLHKIWSDLPRPNAPEIDQSERVQQSLLKLDPKQRAAVVMTVYDGLSHGEAARILGCSETTVSWRIFAARRKLKHALKDLRCE